MDILILFNLQETIAMDNKILEKLLLNPYLKGLL